VDLTSDDVRDILQLLDGLPYRELTLETASFRLSLRRDPASGWTQTMQVLAEPNVLPSGTAAPVSDGAITGVTGGAVTGGAVTGGAVTGGAATGGAVTGGAVTGGAATDGPVPAAGTGIRAAAGESLPTDGLVAVRAPLLGTFYRAPRPGAPPFVTVGSEVAPDTVVCIIETMKLMNSVTAGVGGTVAEILLDNAQFAPQGAVLMRVREQR
jgi:acetyl-CoA carboxylase biotin carboxyl carrier protein